MAELGNADQSLPNDARFSHSRVTFSVTARAVIKKRRYAIQRAIEKLDPRHSILLRQVAFSYNYLRRYKEEEGVVDREMAIRPNDVCLKASRAFVELDWKADTRPLHEFIDQFGLRILAPFRIS